MKKYICLLYLLVHSLCGAQAQQPELQIQKAYTVCMNLRTAIGSGSTAALKAANAEFKLCGVKPFTTLRSKDPEPLSLNGHFIFDAAFVDSLVAGRSVYRFAQRYADAENHRHISHQTGVYLKNYAIRKKSSSQFYFHSRGIQEIAVIAEPKGRVTLRVYDPANKKYYNDTVAMNEGKASRISVIHLPEDKITLLQLEIMNQSNKDISVAILSN